MDKEQKHDTTIGENEINETNLIFDDGVNSLTACGTLNAHPNTANNSRKRKQRYSIRSDDGSTDLIQAENWIKEIEKILVVLHCTKEQKVAYATFKFTGEAERWRESERKDGGVYDPDSGAAVSSVARKAWKFERGLKKEIRKQTVILQLHDFATLMDKATVAEESLQEDTEVQIQKKRPAPLGSYSSVRQGTWKKYSGDEGLRRETGRGTSQGTTSSSACPTCGKGHSRKCSWGSDTWYQFSKPGHLMQDCGTPRSNAPPQ
ncbi:uncharacterized protein LOC131158684 [Malania oleifera]|uniref:uncharacterized protein LOC131158684 n=1 Tax=Malania oleifera TaxID=397392 RepID=UPI0025AE0E2B|nr:uncharacterized protein LOC131158684 [Malania oleifera]